VAAFGGTPPAGAPEPMTHAAPAPAATTSHPRLVATLAVGLAAGFLSGLFGVGGGILIVPGLVLVLKMDQRLAHGTSLAAVLPISLASLLTYWSHGNVDWPVALFVACGAVVGAIVGTHLLHVIPHRALGFTFAVVLVVSAVRLFLPFTATGRGALVLVDVLGLVGTGLLSGVLAGLLGVGGGVVMIPPMVVLLGLPPVMAKGTSLAVIVPTALIGTLRNRSRNNADLRVAAVVGLAGIVSAVGGGWLSDKLSDTTSNMLFAILLLAVAARMVWTLERERRDLAAASEPEVGFTE
jgi:uncharacterized protein